MWWVGPLLKLAEKLLTSPQDRLEFERLVRAAEESERQFQARVIEAVNRTMQAEARSEHLLQWAWRPIVGLTFAATIINNYIVMPYFPAVQPIAIPSEVWSAMLVVLGAAAATRGWEKVERARNGEPKIRRQPLEEPTPGEGPQGVL